MERKFMCRDFAKEFPDLLVFDDGPKGQLRSIDGEEFSFPEQSIDEVTIFLLSQNDDGFIAKYCTSRQTLDKMVIIKNALEKDNNLLLNIINHLNSCLPVSYEEFSEMGYVEQNEMVRKTKRKMSKEDREAFDKVFKDLFEKSKTMKLTANKSGDTHEN